MHLRYKCPESTELPDFTKIFISLKQFLETFKSSNVYLHVAPRLYLMKGKSGNLQLPLSTTILSSISSEIINLAAEYFLLYIKKKKKKTTLTEHIRADNKTSISNRFLHCTLQQNSLVKSTTDGT
jgi:hypothetical protein